MILKPKTLRGMRVVELEGLQPFYDCEGKNACVDASIGDVILLLNGLGWITYVSCSGLPEDHPDDPFAIERAYVGFRQPITDHLARLLISANFAVDPNHCAYMWGYTGKTDALGRSPNAEIARRNWAKLQQLLTIEWYKQNPDKI